MDKRQPSLIIGEDIPQRIGLISDVHGNYLALQRALTIFKSHKIQKYFFLGDSVGYIPSLKALDIIYKNTNDFICIKGNHEDMLLNNKISSKKNKIYLLDQIKSKVTSEIFDFISSWKSNIAIKYKNKNFLFVHGSPNDYTYGYIYPNTELSQFKIKHNFIFMGHSHWSFKRSHGNKQFINPGSCGLPRDHGQYGSIGIFNFEDLRYQPIRFDISDTFSKLAEEYPLIDKRVLELRNRKRIQIPGEQIA